MNSSDRQNPRRLIRAIEVAGAYIEKKEGLFFDTLFVGLKLTPDERDRRISLRVDARVKAGVLEEINNLLEMGVKWDNQSMSSLGYKQLGKYYDKTQSLSEAVDTWKKAEMKYAKRQMTWFKKDKRINWFDISKKDYVEKIEIMVRKWHNKHNIEN
jgi:tRNA dimethylallyltransferase